MKKISLPAAGLLSLLTSFYSCTQVLEKQPTASFSLSTRECNAPCAVTFSVNQIQDGLTYRWIFHDDSTATGTSVQKTYARFGTYKVILITTSAGAGSVGTTDSIEVKPETVAIPGGSFLMGDDATHGADIDEMPIKARTVSGFRLGKYEVTIKQYKDFCKATGREFPPSWVQSLDEWKQSPREDNYPMSFLSWYEATDYCKWLSSVTHRKYRLPTEAEWEYAARGGQTYIYAGSNNPDEVAWYNTTGNDATVIYNGPHPVGLKKPNGYGLYDMSGNVLEWTSCWYVNDTPYEWPNGPATGTKRAYKGGSYHTAFPGPWVHQLRVTERGGFTPEVTYGSLGLRVLLEN